MYFKTYVSKKRTDIKEVIINAKDRSDAYKQSEGLKAYFFPNENPEDVICFVSEVQIKNSFEINETYYKVMARLMKRNDSKAEVVYDDFDDEEMSQEDDDSGYYKDIYEADSIEEAKAIAIENILEDGKDASDYEVCAVEMTVKECIDEEIEFIKDLVKDQYLKTHTTDKTTVREYSKLQKTLDGDTDEFYVALKEYNKLGGFNRMIHRVKGYKQLTVGEYEELIKILTLAKSYDEVNEIIFKLNKNAQSLFKK